MIVVNARFLTQNITGVQRFAIEISLHLKDLLKEEVVFIAPKNIVQREFAQKLGVKTIGRHKGHLWEQLDLPRFLKIKGNPLLLCLCNTAPLYYKNKIVTIHDVAFYVFPKMFSKSFLAVYRFMIPRILKSAKHVITVSEFSKKEIIKYCRIDTDKISVVYNAVSGDFKYIGDNNLASHRYFLAVSSLNYRKNFPAVLEAFKKFEESNDSGELYIIGDMTNSSFSALDIDKYKSDYRIKFLGRVSDNDLIRYYSNAVAFIYPSLYEGFGIPPLEAQQCHCPVISSNATSLPEVLGQSVLFNAPADTDGFATNMQRVFNDAGLRKQLIEKGLTNIKRFSWHESAERITSLLKD